MDKRTRDKVIDPLRCTAKSKQSGERCKRRPHPGSNVCVMHGGAAPQSKHSALERLQALVNPAIDTLGTVVKTGIEAGDMGNAVRASVAVLDRCGFHPTQAVEMTGANGGPIGVVQVDLSEMSLEDKVAMAALIEKLGIKPPKPNE